MRAAGLVLAVLALSVPGEAHAQEGEDAAGEAATDPHTEALQLFEQSHGLYQQGDFAQAAALLERAYGLAPEPVLLYNLGRAREGEGEFSAAIDAYQRYLDTAGEIPDRGAIERKIETLQRTVAERATLGRFDETVDGSGPPPPRNDGPPPPPDGGPSVVPWIVAAFGAGGIIAGSVVGAVAQSKASAAEDAPSQAAALAEHESAADFALAANISLAAGGVLLLGGLVWGVIDLLSQGETPVYHVRAQRGPTARVAISPWGASVEGTF